MKNTFLLCLVALSLCISCSKDEYESFGTIYGVVSDSWTGDPLPNATITLSPGGVTKLTGSDGLFEYNDLTPQQYTITVQKTGYQTNRKTITAIVDSKVEANIALTPIQ